MSEAQDIMDDMRAGGLDIASAAAKAATSKDEKMLDVAKDLINCLRHYNKAGEKLKKMGATPKNILALEGLPRGSNRDSDMSMEPLGEHDGERIRWE